MEDTIPSSTSNQHKMKLDWKVLTLVLLLVILPLSILVIRGTVYKRGKGAGNAVLKFLPGVTAPVTGNWKFTKDQNVSVDLLVNNANNYSIQGVEAIVHYDPTKLSVVSYGCSPDSLNALKYEWLEASVSSPGTLSFSCLGIQKSSTPAPWGTTPPAPDVLAPSSTDYKFGTIIFKPLETTTNATITYEFTSGSLNDSNVVSTDTTNFDVLGSVQAITYDILPSATGATLSFVPSSGTYSNNGTTFTVDVMLNTGGQDVDSVDVIATYNKNALQATQVVGYTEVGNSNTFSNFTGIKIDESGTDGRFEISGYIATPPTGGSVVSVNGANIKVATVTFRTRNADANAYVNYVFVNGQTSGDSNVVKHITDVTLPIEDILSTVYPATYNISAIQPTNTPTNTPTATRTPTPTVTPTPGAATPTPTPTGGVQPTPTPTATRTPTPTPTVTPTPTTPVQQVNINLGKINLQGRAWTGAPLQRNIRLIISGGTVNHTYDGRTNNTTGIVSFSMTNTEIPAGTYSFLIKPEGYLQLKLNNVALSIGSNPVAVPVTFPGGDFSGDGKINALDLPGMITDWKGNTELYDLDGNGEINSLDLVIVISNWNGLDVE